MGIYILLFFFLSLCSFLSFCKGIPKKNIYWLSVILLIVIASFRGIDVGTDTQQYFYNFKYVMEAKERASFSGTQMLFYYYTFILNQLTNYDLFMLLNYTIGFGGIGWFIWRCSPYKIVSLLLFFLLFYLASLNVMRQYISMGIFGLALTNLFNNKKEKYIIYTLIAGCIHFSALLMLPLVFFNELKLSKITVVSLVLISFYVGFFSNIMQPIVQIFEIFSFLNDNVSGYIGNWGRGEGRNLGSNIVINLAFIITYSLAKNTKSKSFFMWFIFVVASNLLGAAGQANRIFLYLLLGVIIAVPECLYQLRNNTLKKFVLMGFDFSYTIGFWVVQLITGVNEVVPYSFR